MPIRRSHRLLRLFGLAAFLEFPFFLLFIFVAGPAFPCDEFEVYLSMAQEDSQRIKHAERGEGVVAGEDIVDVVLVLLKELFGLFVPGLDIKIFFQASKEFADAPAFGARAEFLFCVLP